MISNMIPGTPDGTPGASEEGVSELLALLDHHRAILVHFSGSRADLSPEQQYPFNLRYAVTNPVENSFSTVRPCDDAQKHWGSFGIVGCPNGVAGITGIGPHDWGTWRTETGQIEVPEHNGSIKTCQTILEDNSNEYDEWVLNAYSVRGLFAFADEHIGLGFPPSVTQLRKDFPGLPIFTATGGQFVLIGNGGSFQPVSVPDIYKHGHNL